jgi:RNA polymerase sigma-70 factor (ECF subfamily)
MDKAIEVAAGCHLETETTQERLGALFEAHHGRLYRLARRLVSTPDEARDLVQDTFVRAARAPGAVPVGMPYEEAWLVRVLINLCRDRWRRQDTWRRYRERHDSRSGAGVERHPEAALVAQATVWRALMALPPRRRAVVVLHEIEGASTVEIAGLLGIAAVTVRWHLSRGRQQLARILKDVRP